MSGRERGREGERTTDKESKSKREESARFPPVVCPRLFTVHNSR